MLWRPEPNLGQSTANQWQLLLSRPDGGNTWERSKDLMSMAQSIQDQNKTNLRFMIPDLTQGQNLLSNLKLPGLTICFLNSKKRREMDLLRELLRETIAQLLMRSVNLDLSIRWKMSLIGMSPIRITGISLRDQKIGLMMSCLKISLRIRKNDSFS